MTKQSKQAPDQLYRQARLKALSNHPDYRGNRAKLGRDMGLRSGAYVRQMLDGERPISEKRIAQLNAMRGGKFRGWFDRPDASSVQGGVSPDWVPALSQRLSAALDELRAIEAELLRRSDMPEGETKPVARRSRKTAPKPTL